MAYNGGKNSYIVVCQEGKSIFHQSFGKSKILTQTKSPILLLPLKSHMVGPL